MPIFCVNVDTVLGFDSDINLEQGLAYNNVTEKQFNCYGTSFSKGEQQKWHEARNYINFLRLSNGQNIWAK